MVSEVAVSVWQGSFTILGVELRCHVLSDGQRIVEAESMVALLAAMAEPAPAEAVSAMEAELERLVRWEGGNG